MSEQDGCRFKDLPFNKKLVALRKEARMMPEDFAVALGVPADFYEKCESGCLEQCEEDHILEKMEIYTAEIGDIIYPNDYPPTPVSIALDLALEQSTRTVKEWADKLGLEEISLISWRSGERVPNKKCFALLDSAFRFGNQVQGMYKEYSSMDAVDKTVIFKNSNLENF